MKRCFFTLFLTIALTAAAVTAELETRDVTVEQVDPAGLTIGFINENGTSVLKRIPFEELDAAVQQQYRYDPERARRYEERREQLSRDSIEEMKASSEQAGRTETIRAKLRERFNGKNVEVSRDDLLFLIRSNRRALRVNGVEAAESGTLVRVLQDDSGLDALPMMILADGLKLKTDESWTGFLYPTGLKARIQGNANLPVLLLCRNGRGSRLRISRHLLPVRRFRGERRRRKTGVRSGDNDRGYHHLRRRGN